MIRCCPFQVRTLSMSLEVAKPVRTINLGRANKTLQGETLAIKRSIKTFNLHYHSCQLGNVPMLHSGKLVKQREQSD
jgi:hypothetical protein